MVAKLHYEADMAQVEIARKIGVSTASVSRLLQKARALGIVKIEVQDLPSLEELTVELTNALGLKRAAVIEAPSVGALGALAAPVDALIKDEGLQSGSVVGIGWGRAVREVLVAGLSPVPGIRAVALNGGMQQSPRISKSPSLYDRQQSNSAGRLTSSMLRTCRRRRSEEHSLTSRPCARL